MRTKLTLRRLGASECLMAHGLVHQRLPVRHLLHIGRAAETATDCRQFSVGVEHDEKVPG
jgi:hypothetical protein